MKKTYKSLVGLLLLALLSLPLFGCAVPQTAPQAPVSPGTSGPVETPETPDGTEAPEESEPPGETPEEPEGIVEDGRYYTADDVAEYLHTFGKLPQNFITKNKAEDLGWVSSKGNLWEVTDRMVIGGDRFGNREGLLPSKSGRTWYECDVNYEGGYRGSERIVFSNDGLIYYTKDHYASFKKLY
ncbi:MAG TPA: ribonuclease domain-containing protein [Clostridiaceae bacterium]|nr:ribonuclease domain-containing protein [Clostridiaceae bacterium]